MTENVSPRQEAGSRFNDLLGTSDVDDDLRSFLAGAPGVVLPPVAQATARSHAIPPLDPVAELFAAMNDEEPAAPVQVSVPEPVAVAAPAVAVQEPAAFEPAGESKTDLAALFAEAVEAMGAEGPALAEPATEAFPAVDPFAALDDAAHTEHEAAVVNEPEVAVVLEPMAIDASVPLPALEIAPAVPGALSLEEVFQEQEPRTEILTVTEAPAADDTRTAVIATPVIAEPLDAADLWATLDGVKRPVANEPVAVKAPRSAGLEEVMHAQHENLDEEFVTSIKAVLDLGASDLHLASESTPMIRMDGELRPVEHTTLWDRERIERVIRSFVPKAQMDLFDKALELDLAYSVGDICRFRVNIFRDQRGLGAALRIIPHEIKSVTQLGLPPELVDLAKLHRGLVLVCGPTGSGKSTTLAAIIDRVNATRAAHIVTVEDPIEFLHHHKKSVVNQREVGADTHSFSDALKHALRQDPDVILVGEMRDLETISTALTAAETGHLVFGTLHTQDAGQTIDRIIDVYPSHQQAQVRTQLSATLRAVVVQTLIRRSGGKGRAVATEFMLANPAVQALVRAGKTHQLRTILQGGAATGMHTMDQDLARLVAAGDIEYSVALDIAQDPSEFDQLVKNRGLSSNAQGELPMQPKVSN